jgi:hypothetical protein
MKKAKDTEEQIVGILHEAAAGGTTMKDVARRDRDDAVSLAREVRRAPGR